MKIKDLDLGLGLVLAPIAGVTARPFRMLAKRGGADLVYTEMISSAALVRHPQKVSPYVLTCREERPIAAQIFGSAPSEMAEAAALLSEKEFDLIDINMGCPVKKVIKSGAGAALLRDPVRAVKIIQAVVQSSSLPVTIKMRSGWDRNHLCAVEMARAAEDAGVAAVILHPRTRAQGFSGRSDWDMIRDVKQAVSIPIIGNGDIRSPEDAERMFKETGCDGIMIGRAALGNPWIFEAIRSYLLDGSACSRPEPGEVRETLLEHLRMEVELSGEKRGVLRMRKFAAWYSRALPESAEFRNRVNRKTGVAPFIQVVDDYFSWLENTSLLQRVGL